VLQHFMDANLSPSPAAAFFNARDTEMIARQEGRARVRKVLEREGLQYHRGGRVTTQTTSGAARSLHALVRTRDLTAIEAEVTRALTAVDTDPPAALTAACSLVEAFCKVYLEDNELPFPNDQSIKPLWAAVQSHLGLDPAGVTPSVIESDLKRILGGLASVVDGLGAFRTHAGSAHGRGRGQYRVASRHARLAVNAAHSLVLFAMETWDVRAAAGASAGTRDTT
jgi:hypothetical protein